MTQNGQTASTFATLSDFLGNGSHSVSATLSDPTTFVRLDASNVLKDTITWNFTLSGQIPATLANWRTTYGSDKTVLTSDRLPNLIKYALGLAANVPAAPAQMPAASMLPVTGQSSPSLSRAACAAATRLTPCRFLVTSRPGTPARATP
jgi:hypothetical protein